MLYVHVVMYVVSLLCIDSLEAAWVRVSVCRISRTPYVSSVPVAFKYYKCRGCTCRVYVHGSMRGSGVNQSMESVRAAPLAMSFAWVQLCEALLSGN